MEKQILKIENTASICFVLLYGSGFVIGKFGILHANPISFLFFRFLFAEILFSILCFYIGDIKFVNLRHLLKIALPGCFGLFGFSNFSFFALYYGINPALLSLIVALQPLIVSIIAPLKMGEKINFIQCISLIIGFFGVFLVVGDRIIIDDALKFNVLFAILAMISLSIGNITQKYLCSDMDLFWGGCIQNFSSALLCLIFIPLTGGFYFLLTFEFLFSLVWMIIVVSVGAVSIMYFLISIGKVSKVTNLFFLMPIVALILSYFLFDYEIEDNNLLGIFVTCGGVFLFYWFENRHTQKK